METRALATGAALGEGRLFVGSLPLTTQEGDVQALFAQFGEAQVQLLPPKDTAKFLAAYVTLPNGGASLDAIAHFKDGEVRVLLADEKSKGAGRGALQMANNVASHYSAGHQTYSQPAGPNCRLFVGRMPPTIDEYTMAAIFQSFGPCEIQLLPAKGSTRCGYVSYTDTNTAQTAMHAVAHDPHLGFKVDFAEPKKGEMGGAPQAKRQRVDSGSGGFWPTPVPLAGFGAKGLGKGDKGGKGGKAMGKGGKSKGSLLPTHGDAGVPRLFIGRLGPEVSEIDVRGMCQQYGEVAACNVLEGKGVAYVTFTSWLAAELACEGITTVAGYSCQWAKPRSGDPYGPAANPLLGLDDSRLFVGGLDRAVQAPHLEPAFTPYGIVTDINVVQGKGIAYVSYDRWGAAKDAIANVADIQTALGQRCNLTFADARKPQNKVNNGW
jgi:RNA recognition motif-containing protein